MNKSNSQRILPLILKEHHHTRMSSRQIFSSNASVPATPFIPSRGGHSISSTKEDSFHNVFDESREVAKNKPTRGPAAKLEFYDDYKNILRLNEKLTAQKVECTSNIAYLSSLDQSHMRPKTFGLVAKKTGSESAIDLRMFSMGDQYAEAFSKGLKHYPALETLNLKSNRLTDTGNENILKSIDLKQIKRINLSENKLGPKSLEKIIEMMTMNDCKLKHLNLEKTNISSMLISSLLSSLHYNRRLTKLIVAKNNLTDAVTKPLKEFLLLNQSLKVLDLHWNNFGPGGAVNIFEAVAKNKCLMILDISWNSIGKSKASSDAIAKAVRLNNILAHLDLSYNSIITSDAEIIAEGLKSNHTLLGIHLIGNACSVDSKGFLLISNKKQVKSCHFYQRLVDRPKFVHEKANINCWVCEKWVEVTFECESEGENVFIHLDIDEFQPEAMLSAGKGRFEITRAVPHRPISFFFSELDSSPITCTYPKLQRSLEISAIYNEDMKKLLKISILQVISPEGEVCNIKSPFYPKPRTKVSKFLMVVGQSERIEWSIKISLFKDYRFDSEKLLDECFEFDWRHSRLSNFIRNSEDHNSIRSLARQYYPQIKLAYKNLSAYGASDVFSIGSNVFTDFLNECKIIDSLYGLSDLGVNLNSTLIQKEKGQLYNSGNSLVRYEFLEILIRVAGDRYIRNKKCATYTEAFTRLLNEHLLQVFPKFVSNKWRENKYCCEEVDLVLKVFKPLFMSLFGKYSGKQTLPGKKTFVSLEEFRMLCADAGLVGERFATREIDLCFSQSMMTQVDELYFKRHLEMGFVEMLEGLSRAIDYSDAIRNIESYTFVSIISTELSKKLEYSMSFLIKLTPVSFQDDFDFPTAEHFSRLMYRMKVN